MIIVDDWHAQLIKEMDEEKHLSVRTKLGWLRGLQAKELDVVRQQLESGYFRSRNMDTIGKLQRRQTAAPAK
ncbi:MAG TPA: hypothetical protein VGD52_16700 [Pseudoduganella sp.]